MRLDKYLKVSRIIKRRSVAKQVSEAERIYVNNHIAKPSKDIKIGDIITIHYGKRIIEIEVTDLTISTKKDDSYKMYNLIKEEMVG